MFSASAPPQSAVIETPTKSRRLSDEEEGTRPPLAAGSSPAASTPPRSRACALAPVGSEGLRFSELRIFPAQPLADELRGGVQEEGEHEEQKGGEKKSAVERAA